LYYDVPLRDPAFAYRALSWGSLARHAAALYAFETRCASALALSALPGRVQQGRTSAVLLRVLAQLPA
jgi:hypothetical protein